MKGLEQATLADIARAAMERLQKLGVNSEFDAERNVGKGSLELTGEVVANLWDGTPVAKIAFVTEGIDHIRLCDPGYLSDATPLTIDAVNSAKDLASAAARAHDVWVGKLTDLDVELARLKLGHRLHASRGLYVVNRRCGKHQVEFGIRPDGMIEILAVDGAPVPAAGDARVFPFAKSDGVAELEAAVLDHVDRLAADGKNGTGITQLIVRFRDAAHLRSNLENAIRRGGLFIQWEGNLAVGSRVHFKIELLGHAAGVESEGEVAVVLGKEEAAKQNRQPGIGIKLSGSASDLEKKLESLLASTVT
jgi:Tfp pilus assembly protein PilZ